MWTPNKDKELTELDNLINKEIKEDNSPDYQQYIILVKAGALKNE